MKSQGLNEGAGTVVLVDGFDNGHHLTHLCNYARALLQQGCDVYEFLPDPSRVQSWFETHCPEHLSRLHLFVYSHPKVQSPSWRLRGIIEPLMLWRILARRIRVALSGSSAGPVKLVHILWLDDYIVGASRWAAWALPRVFPFRWSGLFFHPWHLRIAGGESRWASLASEAMLQARNCVGVTVLDHGISDQLASNTGRPVLGFPDETDEVVSSEPSAFVEQIRARAKGRKIVGLLGHLGKRKGVSALLQAARSEGSENWLYVFAGELSDDQRASFDADTLRVLDDAIAGQVENVLVIPERIEHEAEFNAVVMVCDVLYAAYEMFAHSSGIVTKAGVLEKPVLVSQGFYMQEVVEQYRLGLAIESGQATQVNPALAILGDADAFMRTVGKPDYESFRAAHGVNALGPALERLLALCD